MVANITRSRVLLYIGHSVGSFFIYTCNIGVITGERKGIIAPLQSCYKGTHRGGACPMPMGVA